MKAQVSMWFYKESYWYNRDSRVYVVLQRIILVQIETSRSMWFYKESYWYKWRLQCLGYFTQNHTGTHEGFSVLCDSTKNYAGTTRDSRVYVVLQGITLVQIWSSGSMWFYKESFWHK